MSSAPYPDGVASNCIDGITTSSGFLCHTNYGGQQWLVITVTGYNVNKIVVYNRINGYQDRINGATIKYSYDFAGTSIIHQSSFGSTASLVYTFDFGANTLMSYVGCYADSTSVSIVSRMMQFYYSDSSTADGCKGESFIQLQVSPYIIIESILLPLS